ncbi:MAG: squalene synthase HpnD, partial [Gammaproteobacteria bacterium]
KLNWWREEVARLFQRRPRHPVTRALLEPVERFNLPEEYFLEVLDGMAMDLIQHSYADFKSLQLYCYRVAGVVGLMAAEIFGYTDRRTLDYAQNLGLAFQLTNIIRDIREDGQRQRLYLPLNELTPYGLTQQDLWQPSPPESALTLIRFQISRARNFYKKAMESLPDADRYTQRSGLAMAAIYLEVLEKIHQNPRAVFNERISLSPLRKLWLTWRTLRSIKKTPS